MVGRFLALVLPFACIGLMTSACDSSDDFGTEIRVILSPVLGFEQPNPLQQSAYNWITLVDNNGERLLQFDRTSGATRATEFSWALNFEAQQFDVIAADTTIYFIARGIANNTFRTDITSRSILELQDGFVAGSLQLTSNAVLQDWFYAYGANATSVVAASADAVFYDEQTAPVQGIQQWVNAVTSADGPLLVGLGESAMYQSTVSGVTTQTTAPISAVTTAMKSILDGQIIGGTTDTVVATAWATALSAATTTSISALTQTTTSGSPYLSQRVLPVLILATYDANNAATDATTGATTATTAASSTSASTEVSEPAIASLYIDKAVLRTISHPDGGLWLELADSSWVRMTSDSTATIATAHLSKDGTSSLQFSDNAPFSDPALVVAGLLAPSQGPYLSSQILSLEFEGNILPYAKPISDLTPICDDIAVYLDNGGSWSVNDTTTPVVLDDQNCWTPPRLFSDKSDDNYALRPTERWVLTGDRAGLLDVVATDVSTLAGNLSIQVNLGQDAPTRGDQFDINYVSGLNPFEGQGILAPLRIQTSLQTFFVYDRSAGRISAWNYQTGDLIWSRL